VSQPRMMSRINPTCWGHVIAVSFRRNVGAIRGLPLCPEMAKDGASDAMGQMETHRLSLAALRCRSFVSIDPDLNTGILRMPGEEAAG